MFCTFSIQSPTERVIRNQFNSNFETMVLINCILLYILSDSINDWSCCFLCFIHTTAEEEIQTAPESSHNKSISWCSNILSVIKCDKLFLKKNSIFYFKPTGPSSVVRFTFNHSTPLLQLRASWRCSRICPSCYSF